MLDSSCFLRTSLHEKRTMYYSFRLELTACLGRGERMRGRTDDEDGQRETGKGRVETENN